MNPLIKQAFTRIYSEGSWRCGDTNDGTGSTVEFAASIMAQLPPLLRRWGVTSMLDAGCGEFTWLRHCDLSGITYVGGDVIADKIQKLRCSFPQHQWIEFDVTEDPFPLVDVWMSRDTLIHLTNSSIIAALRNFIKSGITYALLSHTDWHANGDIQNFGEINHINWYAEPWLIDPALDHCDDFNRKMLLFGRDQISEMLTRLPSDD